MKAFILQEKVPSRSDFNWTFSSNCEGTEQLHFISYILQQSYVTMDELDMSRDGIRHRNIRDFLLAKEWN